MLQKNRRKKRLIVAENFVKGERKRKEKMERRGEENNGENGKKRRGQRDRN